MNYSQAEILAINLSTMLETKGVVGFKIARNLRMINDELREYYEYKQELFKKYGEEVDGNLVINKDSENYPLFLNEIKQIADTEVNFDFRKITEEELIDSGLTAKQMAQIWELVDGKN